MEKKLTKREVDCYEVGFSEATFDDYPATVHCWFYITNKKIGKTVIAAMDTDEVDSDAVFDVDWSYDPGTYVPYGSTMELYDAGWSYTTIEISDTPEVKENNCYFEDENSGQQLTEEETCKMLDTDAANLALLKRIGRELSENNLPDELLYYAKHNEDALPNPAR